MSWLRLGRALGILIALAVITVACIEWDKTTREGPCAYYPYPCGHPHRQAP